MKKDETSQMDKILDEFCASESEKVAEIAESVSKDVKNDLKRTSPRSKGGRKHYANGWAVSVKKIPGGGAECVVYNKTKPRLTHLLEKGHAKADGGRVAGIEHIRPAEERGVDEFIKRLEAEL